MRFWNIQSHFSILVLTSVLALFPVLVSAVTSPDDEGNNPHKRPIPASATATSTSTSTAPAPAATPSQDGSTSFNEPSATQAAANNHKPKNSDHPTTTSAEAPSSNQTHSTDTTNKTLVAPTGVELGGGGSVAERANSIDLLGTNQFYGGVEKLSIGIAELSQAEQDRKAVSSDTPEIISARDAAIVHIAQGNHDIDAGHAAVNQANKIRINQNLMVSAGVNSGLSTHSLAFDREKAPASTNKALEVMESTAGVPAESLIEVVNEGHSEHVMSLAAGAQEVEMSAAEITNAVSNYTAANYAASENPVPSTPVSSGDIAANTLLPNTGVAEVHRGSPRELASEHQINSTVGQRLAVNESRHESQSRPEFEQILGLLKGAEQSETSEFGNPDNDLFHRVSDQYSKRRVGLRRVTATTALRAKANTH